jgi:hypothetical protein
MEYFTKLCDFADEEAQWMNDLPLHRLKFKERNFELFEGIFFIPTLTIAYKPDTPVLEFSNIVHELRHAWQYKTMGKAKYFFMKAFNRKALEDDAWNEEKKAIDWLTADEVMSK